MLQVLLVGSRTRTVVGRPSVAAQVMTTVEEQTRSAKVIVFKKKRRKGYKKKMHYRREITLLRIGDIECADMDTEL